MVGTCSQGLGGGTVARADGLTRALEWARSGVGAQVPGEGRVCAQARVSGWSCLFPTVF